MTARRCLNAPGPHAVERRRVAEVPTTTVFGATIINTKGPVSDLGNDQERISLMLRRLKHTFARIQKGRTETALMRLSDATLRDIGITRGEISHVAGIVVGLVPSSTFPGSMGHQKRRRPGGNLRDRDRANSLHDHPSTRSRQQESRGASLAAVRNEVGRKA